MGELATPKTNLLGLTRSGLEAVVVGRGEKPIRADLADSIEANTVHGSDSLENAAREIAYFFAETDLCPR